MFWEDVPVQKGRAERGPRVMPSIPETGWRPPTYLPDLSAAKVISLDCETWDPDLIEKGPGWARHKGHIDRKSVV